jgi:hypothetical protein
MGIRTSGVMRCFNCFVARNKFDWSILSMIPNLQQRLLVSEQRLLPLMTTIMTCNNQQTATFLQTALTSYHGIDVWFDEQNRTNIINMGASPTMQELDSRQFVNKRTYNKCLLTYLDTSNENENDAINGLCV